MEESEVSFPRESYNIESGNQEASGVWANWRARKILKVMKQNELKLLWEVGSGHGNVAIPLQREDMAVIGIEPLFSGAAITAMNGVRTYQGTLESLKLPSNSLSAIGVFDVLEHLEKPEVLLSEIYRTLKPGGVLLVSVPAHQWLFSDFDKSIGHYRRYSREILSQQLKKSGFINTEMEFMFAIFILPAFILRKLPSLFGSHGNSKKTIRSCSNQSKVIKFLEPILLPLLYLERQIRLPFGLSLFSISRK